MTSRKSSVGRRSQAGVKRVPSPPPDWETVFRVLHDPGVILGPDFRLLHANRAAQQAVGSSEQELKGRYCYEIFHGTHAPPPGCPLEKLKASKHAETAEMEVELLRGAYRISCAPILDEDGNIQSVIHLASDISARKQAEEALRASEERYHTLFDRMMDGIYRSTHEGRFVDVNPAMLKMFGYSSREEMLAVDIKKELYFAPEERGSHILDTGREEIETYRMRRKDGSEIWVEDHGYYIHNAQGEPIYHAGMLRDITERKKAEDELRTIKESLESANRELQQLLAREQLLARTDDLTGLCNRRQFFELAEREFAAAVRYRRPLSILMFDADDFKQVNDIFGHAEGDKALAQIAQIAAAQVRAVDVLARYGGDEFALLLPQADAQQALLIAERIRAGVAAAARVGAEQSPFAVTLSIGIAGTRRDPPDESVERVLQRADEALYAAKAKGRNRIVIFDAE